MADDSRMRVSAAVGLYDSVHQFLKLTQDVHLRSPSYDVTLADAPTSTSRPASIVPISR